ncbi:MAG TPA: phosphoglucosamine mutase [Actinomycetota bacterium]|nr:phosphoglucosamine mutase [Actinomycetota bacterium]
MSRLFGTDGVRGVVGEDLTLDLAKAIGRAVTEIAGGGAPRVMVGRDTRSSGPSLEGALTRGIEEAGGQAVSLGVVPTPAVAFLTAQLDGAAGIVVSASHNPPEYNGIKVFDSTGQKLADDLETEVEQKVLAGFPSATTTDRVPPRTEPDASGGAAAVERYVSHLTALALAPLDGMKIVIDCANGAAHRLGPEVLRRLGASVVAINDAPDGSNINVGCGATHPEVLSAAVVGEGADAGVAHDGDADRAIFADAEGGIVDGDHVIAACALAMKEDGTLAKDTVVTTVMANLGFRRAMEDAGITVESTRVGDRFVLEEMQRVGASLGGEQSGHVIFLDHATTGDGLLTAVRFLTLAASRGLTVEELASCVRKLPQVLIGVEVKDRGGLEQATEVWQAVRTAEQEMGDGGRILVRSSGTEPLVRVMVEAELEADAQRHAEAIAQVVRSSMGA